MLIDLEPRVGRAERGHIHDHGVPFETWSWRGGPVDEATVRAMAEQLPASIVRAKGLVTTGDGALVFQRVGDRWSLTPTDQAVAQSQLVAIGVPGALDERWLADRLDGGD